MVRLPYITEADTVWGKRVIVRASLNVPIKDGSVQNYFRIMRAIPTLLYLKEKGARVIIVTHVGRDPHNTVEPIYNVLKEHMDVRYVPSVIGRDVERAIGELANGKVLLLENVRSQEHEVTNNDDFAAKLASYGEVYVNDAFADSHREHASIVGIPKYLRGYFGITFRKEFEELSKAIEPKSPSLFILAGAKFETKQPLIEKFSKTYDEVFIGGALANDFLKAKGYEIGDSLISKLSPKDSSLHEKKNILLPVDVVLDGPEGKRTASSGDVHTGEKILDVGPKTIQMLKKHIQKAKTVLWNGTLGNYENGYAEATRDCAKLIAESDAYSVVGGGDTIAAIESLAINDKFTYVSTAGGAMLTFLENETLVGIDAVCEK